METYRSGRNELDSKSGCPQGHVGSNPTVSAKSPPNYGGIFLNGILKDNGSEMAFQRKRIAVFHKSKSGGDTKNENKRNAKRDISKQAE